MRRSGPGSTRSPEPGRREAGAIPTPGAPATAAPTWEPGRFDAAIFARLAPAVQERVTVLGEVPELVDFLFLDGRAGRPGSWQKAMAGDEEARPHPDRGPCAAYETCAWEVDALHAATLAIAEGVGRKLGKAQAPIRVAVMGRTRGLPLFDSLAVLGREETRRRLAVALDRLAAEH